MTRSSLMLTRALDRGRAPDRPRSRAGLLAALLRQRAAASVHGTPELEAMLREQIRWSLPIVQE